MISIRYVVMNRPVSDFDWTKPLFFNPFTTCDPRGSCDVNFSIAIFRTFSLFSGLYTVIFEFST